MNEGEPVGSPSFIIKLSSAAHVLLLAVIKQGFAKMEDGEVLDVLLVTDERQMGTVR